MSRQLEWMATLQIGDVLKERSGALRIVRKITRKRNGDLHCVTFTIRRCSWTHRCYTVLMTNDLVQRGFRPVHARVKLKTDLDRRITKAIDQPAFDPYILKCCDVEGIA